jgi:DNA recombination protein RmuC
VIVLATVLSAIAAAAAVLACILAAAAVIAVRGVANRINEHNDMLARESERSRRDYYDKQLHAFGEGFGGLRTELNNSINNFGVSLQNQITGFAQIQQQQLEEFGKRINTLSDKNEARLEKMRETVETRIKELQQDNNIRLDQMREMVDEQLTTKLQKRLDDSFNIVSERLEQVYKGLGEMQSLASGVGDLKKVLTNVKTRGIWGEYQLGNLLEQMLAPAQYDKNVPIPKDGSERVEFAIKMPGKGGDSFVYLPIDAKFPQEDYLRLVDATETGDIENIRNVEKALLETVRSCAKDIRDKYIKPPYTTDFAIMYLPVEGLYAEVLRIQGLAEQLQREYKVVPAGPTTLAALLNSLQMGFRTLAIEQRSNEVWTLLGIFKAEFGKFSDMLQKTHKKLDEASNTMENMEKRTRMIKNKLRSVEELDYGEAADTFLKEGDFDQTVEDTEQIV